MKDNWYILLELEFDPMVTDETLIEKRIEEKRRYWSSKYNDFRIGKQCKTWVAAVPQIKKDMIGPDNKRVQIAREAKDIIYKPIDDMIFAIEDSGKIKRTEVVKIAQKTGKPESLVLKRISEHNISVTSEEEPKDIYEKYYSLESSDDTKFKMFGQLLEALGNNTLYDFLFPNMNIRSIQRYDISKLQQTINTKRKQYTGNDAESSNGQKLCGYCLSVFGSIDSKKKYDDYLFKVNVRTALDELKDIADISGCVKDKNIRAAIRKISDNFGNNALSEKIVMAFIEAERIEHKDVPKTYSRPFNNESQNEDNEEGEPEEKKEWIHPDDSLPIKVIKVIVAIIYAIIQGIIFIAPYVGGFLVILVIIGFFTGHSQELFSKIGSFLNDKFTQLFDWVGGFFEK